MQDQVKADRDRLIVECDELRARVDYLESAIKLGGAAYRAARLGLGAPAVELDDYLALKERAERAEQALADEWDAHKKTRERAEKAERELRRLNRDVALLRAGKPAEKVEDKPAADRVVRVGDVWCHRLTKDHTIAAIVTDDGQAWAVNDAGRLVLHLADDGTPLYADDWNLVSRAPDPLDATTALARLREIADYHADRGGTDLGRALAKVGER